MCVGWALSSVTTSDRAPLCMSCEALLPLLRAPMGPSLSSAAVVQGSGSQGDAGRAGVGGYGFGIVLQSNCC